MFTKAKVTYNVRPEFLASDHFTTQTTSLKASDYTADEDGNIIVPGGTILEDLGILFHDVDLTNTDVVPAAYIDHGFIYADRLPTRITKAQYDSFKGIQLRMYDKSQSVESFITE